MGGVCGILQDCLYFSCLVLKALNSLTPSLHSLQGWKSGAKELKRALFSVCVDCSLVHFMVFIGT